MATIFLYIFKIGFLEFKVIDLIDISLVALLLFQLFRLIRGSVAEKVFIGFLVIYFVYLIVKNSGLLVLSSILGEFTGLGFLAAIILFQQEIRKFLVLLGKTSFLNPDNILNWKKDVPAGTFNALIYSDAAKTLASTNTGALIVFAKSSELKFYQESGDIVDAVASKRLLMTIFNKNSPMHDGAVIVKNDRLLASRCILPISENDELPAYYGMRHRAAIGMTEITDSVVLVVSEETAMISIAYQGKIHYNLSPSQIHQKLNQFLNE
ncbi:MAG: diadenylate cyclase CdaA [Cytophagales bacterium]